MTLPLVRCIHSLKTVQLIYLTVHLTYRRLLGRWEVVRVNWESAKERFLKYLALATFPFLPRGYDGSRLVLWAK